MEEGWSDRCALQDQCRAEGCHWDHRGQLDLDRGRSHQYQE